MADFRFVQSACVAATSTESIRASEAPFADVFGGLVAEAWERLKAAHPVPHLGSAAQAALRDALLFRLSEVTAPTLGHLFNPGLGVGDILMSRLSVVRDDPDIERRSRYEAFCRQLRSDGLRHLFEPHPVLTRIVATVLGQWHESTLELVHRLHDDREALERKFDIDRHALITGLQPSLSDPHRGGRQVCLVEFDGGSRVIYKPKDLRIEARFQDAIGYADSVATESMRALRILVASPNHGYVEFVDHRPADQPELGRFYRNAGRLLCVLYLLGASDCHFENLIASVDQLLLVDPETLFEGTVQPFDGDVLEDTRNTLSRSLVGSVMRTGMLPGWEAVGRAQHASDLSALGAQPANGAFFRSWGWSFVNTDDMVWGRRDVPAAHPPASPVPPGSTLPVAEHVGDIEAGFSEIYGTFIDPVTRSKWDRVIRSFGGLTRRVVVRSTRTYALLQQEGLGPTATARANERALSLEKLARAFLLSERRPKAWPLLQAEIAAMESLDIPYFEQQLGSRDLMIGGGLVIKDYLDRDGLTDSISRLHAASSHDLGWQLRLIRSSITASQCLVETQSDSRAAEPGGAERAPHTPDSIAALLLSAASDLDGRPNWLTLNVMPDGRRFQLGSISHSLYDGRAGLAVFLYDIGERVMAAATLGPTLAMLRDPDQDRWTRVIRDDGLGFVGIGGHLRTLLYLHTAHPTAGDWLEHAYRLVDRIDPADVSSEAPLDLLRGVAGLAAPLARMHSLAASDRIETLMDRIGRALSESQHSSGGWIEPGRPKPLTGWSHGASGIAVAAAEAFGVTGNGTYLACVLGALDYERNAFDASHANWPDFRSSAPGAAPSFMRSWCHGATGIALARLRLLELLPDHCDARVWSAELETAIGTTIACPVLPIDQLCCGNLGRAAVLGLLAERLGRHDLADAGTRLTGEVLEHVRLRGGYRCVAVGHPPDELLPGLMNGVAGIGMKGLHADDSRWVGALLI